MTDANRLMPRSRRSEKKIRKRQPRKRLKTKSRMSSSLSKLALRGDECPECVRRSLHESRLQRKKTRKAKQAMRTKAPAFWKLPLMKRVKQRMVLETTRKKTIIGAAKPQPRKEVRVAKMMLAKTTRMRKMEKGTKMETEKETKKEKMKQRTKTRTVKTKKKMVKRKRRVMVMRKRAMAMRKTPKIDFNPESIYQQHTARAK